MPTKRQTSLLVVVLVLLVSGCRSDERPPRPNVVLYVVDTLRADRLGVYGYERPTSPNIDRLAASSIVFEDAGAPAPWTLPSVASMFLSQLPCEHGVLVDGDRIRPEAVPLAALLKEHGYRTASFHANPYAGKMTGLDHGFDVAKLSRTAAVGTRAASWVESLVGEQPFFLYVHTVEPHNPEYAGRESVELFGTVPKETVERVEASLRRYRTLTRADWDAGLPLGSTDNTDQQRRALGELNELREPIELLYDAAVRDADASVGSLVSKLRENGLWENTLFVLVSDHGEELGDRGGWQHDQSVYEELLHVPFVLRLPRDEKAGSRVRVPVSLLDLVPTLIEYLGLNPLERSRGLSLLPLPDEERDQIDARVTAVRRNLKKYFRPYKESRGDANAVVRQGRFKGIWNAEVDTFELYDLSRDANEREDRSEDERELSARFRGLAHSALARCFEDHDAAPGRRGEGLDEETRRRLESLGYVDPRR